jgi:hypothetical protein
MPPIQPPPPCISLRPAWRRAVGPGAWGCGRRAGRGGVGRGAREGGWQRVDQGHRDPRHRAPHAAGQRMARSVHAHVAAWACSGCGRRPGTGALDPRAPLARHRQGNRSLDWRVAQRCTAAPPRSSRTIAGSPHQKESALPRRWRGAPGTGAQQRMCGAPSRGSCCPGYQRFKRLTLIFWSHVTTTNVQRGVHLAGVSATSASELSASHRGFTTAQAPRAPPSCPHSLF